MQHANLTIKIILIILLQHLMMRQLRSEMLLLVNKFKSFQLLKLMEDLIIVLYLLIYSLNDCHNKMVLKI